MKIAVGNSYSKVLECNNEENKFLDHILSVPMPGHKFMPAFKAGSWDGLKRFYSTAYKTFPTGFLPFIIGQSEKEKFKVFTDDKRNVPALQDPTRINEKYPHLRDYQVKGLTDILTSSLRSENQVLPWQRGVARFQTGTGKTLMAACLTDFIGKRTLFIVERRELMYQSIDVFKTQTKMSVGAFGDGKEELDGDIIFCMVQTIESKFPTFTKLLPNIVLLVIDECHHSSKGIYHKIASKCQAPFRIGLSATPLKRGDLGDVYLIGDCGEIIAEGDREEIQSKGYIAKPKIYIFTIKEPLEARLSYKMAYNTLIVNNDTRNDLIIQAVKKLREKNKSILVLIRIIEHGKILERMIKKSGINCLFVSGKDSMVVRKQAKEAIASKNLSVLIASSIWDEGVDAPLLDAGILAGGGASDIKSIQRVGRILRPKEGSNIVYIIDFKDMTNKYLLNHSMARIKAYEDEKFDISYPKSL